VEVGEVLRDRDFDLDTDIDGIEREGGNGKSSTPVDPTVSRSSPQDVNSSSRAETRSTSDSGDRRFWGVEQLGLLRIGKAAASGNPPAELS
jgi:hypothetical protein